MWSPQAIHLILVYCPNGRKTPDREKYLSYAPLMKQGPGPNVRKENPVDGLEQSRPAFPVELDAFRASVAMLEQGEALQECLRTAALSRDIGVALVQDMPFQASLQRSAQPLVHHLDAALARIWPLNTA